MSKTKLLQYFFPSKMSRTSRKIITDALDTPECVWAEPHICFVTSNPFGTGILITNVLLESDDFGNWDIVYLHFYKCHVKSAKVKMIANFHTIQPENSVSYMDEYTPFDFWSIWKVHLAQESAVGKVGIEIYTPCDIYAAEKTAKKLRKQYRKKVSKKKS